MKVALHISLRHGPSAAPSASRIKKGHGRAKAEAWPSDRVRNSRIWGQRTGMKFTKMHGLGNDFILLPEVPQDAPGVARSLCARRVSVGADGLIAAAPSDKADIRMKIFNADGSEAEMCGNGIRCFAKFVYDTGIVPKKNMSVETGAGIMYPELLFEDGQIAAVRVNMGKPEFAPDRIPVKAEDPLDFLVNVDGAVLPAASVLMGVPHTILYVEGIDEDTIAKLGSAVEKNEIFPKRTNVDFVELVSPDRIRVRTWERGAGRTMACGTGSCASAVISHKKDLAGRNVTVELDAGALQIQIDEDGTVYMTGPAEYVYEGETKEA